MSKELRKNIENLDTKIRIAHHIARKEEEKSLNITIIRMLPFEYETLLTLPIFSTVAICNLQRYPTDAYSTELQIGQAHYAIQIAQRGIHLNGVKTDPELNERSPIYALRLFGYETDISTKRSISSEQLQVDTVLLAGCATVTEFLHKKYENISPITEESIYFVRKFTIEECFQIPINGE